MWQWFTAASIDMSAPKLSLMMLFCTSNLPVTKQILPNLVALLKCCKKTVQASNQLYFLVQQAIEYYYYTEGNCLFFGDAKEILSGEKDYDMEENDNVEEMQRMNL
jgi:hypothetical protein